MSMLRHSYNQQGFVSLPPLLPTMVCRQLNQTLQQAREESFFDSTGFGFLGQNAFEKLPAFSVALYEHPIAKYACQLLETEEVLLFQDLIIWKPPFSQLPAHPPRQVEWHQDYSYWPLRKPSGLTVWIALDESTQQNGAVCYIPRSHSWGECRATLYTQSDSYSESSALPALSIQDPSYQVVSCTAGAGVAHHPLCCHMSPINHTEEHRRAWSLTFLRPDAQWDPAHAPHPLNYQLTPSQKQRLDAPRFPRFSRSMWGVS